MSWEKHSDECRDCRPALLNTETGQALPDDAPEMQKVFGVWAETTLAQREAFHRVTCLNSREQNDLKVMEFIRLRIQLALAQLEIEQRVKATCTEEEAAEVLGSKHNLQS